MRVEYDFGQLVPHGPVVLAIGFFDGVHLGHQRVLTRASELARREGALAIAVTFWPHPQAILQPDVPVLLLTTLDEKLARLDRLGVLNTTIVIPFTPELASLSPAAFLDSLAGWCEPRALVEGVGFALGHKRTGTVEVLQALGAQRGFFVESLEVRDGGERVSSSRIRILLAEGRIADAARLLGQPYMLTGEVVPGDRRGRLLGYPTANLRLDARKMLPDNGIYAVRVRLPGETTTAHAGVASIGVRPTFGNDGPRLVEVYLLDATMDLYGVTLTVELVARLREERRFNGVDALKAQMALDVQQTRDILAAESTHDR